MLQDITFEKVEEVIRLAELARRNPAEAPDDPRRGGTAGKEGVTAPDKPIVPQPARNWRDALELFLSNLPKPALSELVALYGASKRGETPEEILAHETLEQDSLEYLLSREDLAASLQRELKLLQNT